MKTYIKSLSMPKTALSLIVGISNYPDHKLKNPVNDATDVSNALKKLGFVVRTITDATIQGLEDAIEKFITDLSNYDVGLFYYAGHAFQIDGINYLTAIDTNFEAENRVKRLSYNLTDLLKKMDDASNKTSILILDACRNNPYPQLYRSTKSSTLAPMYAPKGTLIAYSTSPGQKALDGVGRNGRYTEALLTHIEDENITIEELFKRVRNTLSAATKGKQISWEHTSLTGSFYFNSHQLISAKPFLYDEKVIADKDYSLLGKTIGEEIIEDLKSHTYSTQNIAIKNLLNIEPLSETKETLFLIGRNILQAAKGGAFEAENFIKNLPIRSKKFFTNKENHLVNGILFEIYFNSTGKFRYRNFKTYSLNDIFSIQYKSEFASCLQFIQEQLESFKDYLFVIPGKPPQTISIDIITETIDKKRPQVNSIKYEGEEILREDKESVHYTGKEINYSTQELSVVKEMIAADAVTPIKQIIFTVNDSSINDSTLIKFPKGYIIQKG